MVGPAWTGRAGISVGARRDTWAKGVKKVGFKVMCYVVVITGNTSRGEQSHKYSAQHLELSIGALDGGGGGSRFHMSILRKVNVALSNFRNAHVTLSILRNAHVPCHYLFKGHVACH